MADAQPFTIEQWYNFLSEGKLMVVRCRNCGAKHLPPKPVCTNCYSRRLEWISLKPTGRLITYTIIHVAPERFQQFVPYAYGIVEFEDGLRLPGMIRDVDHGKIHIGMELELSFEPAVEDWPKWPRYYFRPVKH